MVLRRVVLLLCGLALYMNPGCRIESDDLFPTASSEKEEDSPSQSDLDTDSDTDFASDTVAGSDTDSASDAVADTDTDFASDAVADTDTDFASDTVADTDTDFASDADADTDSNSDTDSNDSTSNCPGAYDLQNCMDQMAKKGGGTIVLAKRTYFLTETLDLEDKVNIVGQGAGTVITWDDSVKDTINDPLLWSSAVENISLTDFTLQCHIDQDPNSSDLRNDNIGLFLYGGGDPTQGESTNNNNINLERLEVFHCSHGIHIKGATDVTAIDLNLHHNGNTEVDYFHNIYWRRVGNLVVKQTTPTSGGYFASTRGHGIRGSNLINVYFENLSVYDNADHGVHVNDVYNMRLHNMDVHDNCANPNGGCNRAHCYGDYCDIDWNAPAE